MIDGSAVLVAGKGAGLVVCEDSVTMSDRAVVRLDFPIAASPLGERFCHVKVYEGAASVQLPTGVTVLRAGETMALNQHAGDFIRLEQGDVEPLV